MIQDIKTLLGASSSNFTDEQIKLCIRQAKAEIKDYCKVDTLNDSLILICEQMVIEKLNKLGREGASSESFGGVSTNFINGYSASIINALNANKPKKLVVL